MDQFYNVLFCLPSQRDLLLQERFFFSRIKFFLFKGEPHLEELGSTDQQTRIHVIPRTLDEMEYLIIIFLISHHNHML